MTRGTTQTGGVASNNGGNASTAGVRNYVSARGGGDRRSGKLQLWNQKSSY